MPPHAVVALDALERNSNAHGDCMKGQRGLASSVPSPTTSGSRGQRSSTGHASVGTINAGLKWLEEHGVITSWIPKAGIYGVKIYRFANHLVRKNLARLKRLMLAQQARLRRSPLALLVRNLNRKKQKTFRCPPSEVSWSEAVSLWAAEHGLCEICCRKDGGHENFCPRGESEHPRIEAIPPYRSPVPRLRPGRGSECPALVDEW
jgi:hypothetical protein